MLLLGYWRKSSTRVSQRWWNFTISLEGGPQGEETYAYKVAEGIYKSGKGHRFVWIEGEGRKRE